MQHDNDNHPRQTSEFTSLADYRTYKASIPETRQRPPGATHLGSRLARERRADDLRRYIDYGRPVVVPTWLSAEGNLPEAGGTPRPDMVTEIKPNSKGEMRRIIELMEDGKEAIKTNSQGHVTHWIGADGKFRPVAELYRQPKGKRKKSEEERQDDTARHLDIPATGGFVERSAYIERGSEGEDYRRHQAARWAQTLCACNDNRREGIDRAGLGGRHTFDEARANARLVPAERGPTAIAKGAEFLAFRVHSNPTAAKGSFVGAPDAVERQIIETMDQPRIDAALGDHLRILDLSIAGLTARQIAKELGLGNTKAAERKVVSLQDAALARLAEVEKMAA